MAKKAQEQAFSFQKDNFLYLLQKLFFIPVYNIKFQKPDFISGLNISLKFQGGQREFFAPFFLWMGAFCRWDQACIVELLKNNATMQA